MMPALSHSCYWLDASTGALPLRSSNMCHLYSEKYAMLFNLFFRLHQWGFLSPQVCVRFEQHSRDADTAKFLLDSFLRTHRPQGIRFPFNLIVMRCHVSGHAGYCFALCVCVCVYGRLNVRPASCRVWIAVPAVCSQWPCFLSCASVPIYSLIETPPTWHDCNTENKHIHV